MNSENGEQKGEKHGARQSNNKDETLNRRAQDDFSAARLFCRIRLLFRRGSTAGHDGTSHLISLPRRLRLFDMVASGL
jgi:hypothetical protein